MCCSRRRQRLQQKQQAPPPPPPQPRGRRRDVPNSKESIASSAIDSALRFPSPARSPEAQPPSYESVMTENKPQDQPKAGGDQCEPKIGEPSSSTQYQDVPDNVTVFSEDPIMYTPPTTRAPTVIFDHDRDEDSEVDSVIEEFRRWESRQSSSASSREAWKEERKAEDERRKQQRKLERRESKDQRRAEKAARKAEKWADRAVKRGHVFEPNWIGSKASLGVAA